MVVLIAIAVHNNSIESEKRARELAAQATINQQREARERALITTDALELENISLTKDFGDYWQFKGTVMNKSAYTLTEIDFWIAIEDCSKNPCVIVGEASTMTDGVFVPPGQARAFASRASFPNLPQSTNTQIKYRVSGTRGG